MSDEALLPGNATPFERAQSQTSARLLDTDTNVIRRERDPAQCDPAFLPFLAAERSVHHYAGDLATKRARTAASFSDHLDYGTADKLSEEISQDCGFQVRVREFFEDARLEWPDYVVEAPTPLFQPPGDLDKARASALRRRNVRDTLAAVRPVYVLPPSDLYYGAACRFGVRIRNTFKNTANRFHGAATRTLPKQRTLPQ